MSVAVSRSRWKYCCSTITTNSIGRVVVVQHHHLVHARRLGSCRLALDHHRALPAVGARRDRRWHRRFGFFLGHESFYRLEVLRIEPAQAPRAQWAYCTALRRFKSTPGACARSQRNESAPVSGAPGHPNVHGNARPQAVRRLPVAPRCARSSQGRHSLKQFLGHQRAEQPGLEKQPARCIGLAIQHHFRVVVETQPFQAVAIRRQAHTVGALQAVQIDHAF